MRSGDLKGQYQMPDQSRVFAALEQLEAALREHGVPGHVRKVTEAEFAVLAKSGIEIHEFMKAQGVTDD